MVEFVIFTVGPWVFLLWLILDAGMTYLKKLDNLEAREAGLARARREIEARSKRGKQEALRQRKYQEALRSEEDDAFFEKYKECFDES